MCVICRIVGRNIFHDQPEVAHDPDDIGGCDPEPEPVYYVWRRSDSQVMITNMHPDDVFAGPHSYHVLTVTSDRQQAEWDADTARSCN